MGVLILLTIAAAALSFKYYEYVFAKDVQGTLIGVERVIQPQTIIGNTDKVVASQLYSFAIAIKTSSGEIFTASSEDRQWSVTKQGECVISRFFPYPPWQLDKAGSYFNARLMKIIDCAVIVKSK